MTCSEKIAFCSGKDCWNTKAIEGVPSVMMCDGPNGLRKETDQKDTPGFRYSEKATCFPTASITACSFDPNLLFLYGKSCGEEALAAGVRCLLGPGLNIKRNPLCGRNFEYFSEDPWLSGALAAAYVRGVQSTGVGACIKHFACNNQENNRMTSDSLVDERALREIYLYGFEKAVRESNPEMVMAAYNLLNGVYCCSNKRLLTDILRKEWGFEGVVVTDWMAVADRTESFLAGCDLVMPGGNAYGEKEAEKNVERGILPEVDVDASVTRIRKFALGMSPTEKKVFTAKEHHGTARKIAEESAVLLKNDDDILPLNSLKDACFIGHMTEEFRFQGYGSSRINPTMMREVRELYPDVPYAEGYDAEGRTDNDRIRAAVSLAEQYRTVILFAGLPGSYESEGFDRPDMKLPEGENQLIEAVTDVNPNTVVVLLSGSAVEIPWAERAKAILYMGLSGQAGAEAAMRLVLGEVNPSGRLAETWPFQYEDCVSSGFYSGENRNAEYRESIYVGYRYYDTANVPVRFPFGYGLSYTDFVYENMTVSSDCRTVCVTVRNTGSRKGKEAVLLFVEPPTNGVFRPKKELKGCEKISLEPDEVKDVTFHLDDRTFSVYTENGWTVYAGTYRLLAGSRSISVEMTGETAPEKGSTWYDKPFGEPVRKEWIALYGRDAEPIKDAPITEHSTLSDILPYNGLMRFIFRIFEWSQAKSHGRDSAEYKGMVAMAKECPLRAIQNNLGIRGNFAKNIAKSTEKKRIKRAGNPE